MLLNLKEILLAFVLPGAIAAAAAGLWRFPLAQKEPAGRILSGAAIVSGYALGAWALGHFLTGGEWRPQREHGWLPYLAAALAAVSLLDLGSKGPVMRIAQAMLFVAAVGWCGWMVVPDFETLKDLRWSIIALFAGLIGVTWSAGEFAALKTKSGFPLLVPLIVISICGSATIGLSGSTSMAFLEGVLVAGLTGLAVFAGGKNQRPIVQAAVPPFAVIYFGLVFSCYVNDSRAFAMEDAVFDGAFALLAASPLLLVVMPVACRPADGGHWIRGLVGTAIVTAPAIVAACMTLLAGGAPEW